MKRPSPETDPVLILACGALVREVRAVVAELAPALRAPVDVAYLPAPLHNRPERIVPAVQSELEGRRRRGDRFGRVVLGYGDCGTGGALDRFVADWNRTEPGHPMTRLTGDHCYAFFTGVTDFEELHAAELGTFFLTDFMVNNFDTLIWQGLGLGTHPELAETYFGNYTRAVYLAQAPTPERIDAARSAAARLGLRFEQRTTGLAPFRSQVHVLLEAG